MSAAITRRDPRTGPFIATKEHRRFVEFADAVRRETFIGVCFGRAGVGKTLSARRYARWDIAEALVERWGPREESDAKVYAALARSRTVLYTPTVRSSHKNLVEDLSQLVRRVDICIEQHVHPEPANQRSYPQHAALIVIDEADRLTADQLEYLRDRFDHRVIGLLLIGMPGLEKSLAAHPQLYSRIGFAHRYHPLSDDELAFVLTRHWKRLRLTLDLDDFTDHEAVAAISRITRGNFRLLHRLFTQIERLLKINELGVITTEIIEAARSTLVIGTE